MSGRPTLAFLVLPDGDTRQVCVGCSELLYERGMLAVAGQTDPLTLESEGDQFPNSIVYMIADPWSLAECRAAIADRHVGKLWGS